MRKLLIILSIIFYFITVSIFSVEFKNLKYELFFEESDTDPNYMFARPDQIVIDKYSNLYIVDNRDCIVRKYNNQGKFVFSCGKRGVGPGELTHINSISVEDEILVLIGHSIINLYDKNGQIICSKRHSIKNSYDLIYEPSLEVFISYRIDEKTKNFSLSYRKFNDGIISEIASYPAKERVIKINDSLSLPCYLFEKIQFSLDSRRNVIFAFSEAFEVYKYSGKKLSLIIKEKINPVLIPESVRKNIIGDIAEFPINGEFKRIIAETPWHYSVIQDLMIDEKDNIWIMALTSDFYGLIKYSPEGKMLCKYPWNRKIEYSQDIYSCQIMEGYLYYKMYNNEEGLRIFRAKL